MNSTLLFIVVAVGISLFISININHVSGFEIIQIANNSDYFKFPVYIDTLQEKVDWLCGASEDYEKNKKLCDKLYDILDDEEINLNFKIKNEKAIEANKNYTTNNDGEKLVHNKIERYYGEETEISSDVEKEENSSKFRKFTE